MNDDLDREIERSKWMREFVESLPPEERPAVTTLHYQLELKRLQLTDEQFFEYLLEQIDFNTRKMDSLIQRLEAALHGEEQKNVVYLDDRRQARV